MQETRGCSVTSGLRPSAPGSTAIFNPRDPKAVLAEFTVLFALPPSLSQVQSRGLNKNPCKGKKGECRVRVERQC